MAKKDGIEELDIDMMKDVINAIEALPNYSVLVGIPEEETKRDDDFVTNAFLGYIHENGAPEANIPARPFLIPGIYNVVDKINSYMRQAGDAALDGKQEKMSRSLHAAGMVASNSVKSRIESGPFVALKASTLAARRNRKIAPRTGIKPLQDTGQLRNSITYVVKDN